MIDNIRTALGRWLLKPELAEAKALCNDTARRLVAVEDDRAALRLRVSGLEDALARISPRSRSASGNVEALILGETHYRGGVVAHTALPYSAVHIPSQDLTVRVADDGEVRFERAGEPRYLGVASGDL